MSAARRSEPQIASRVGLFPRCARTCPQVRMKRAIQRECMSMTGISSGEIKQHLFCKWRISEVGHLGFHVQVSTFGFPVVTDLGEYG